jgi:phosphatidylglycerophosphatase A
MRTFIIAVASGGYIGYIPFASGTFGSLLGIPLFLGFSRLQPVSLLAYVLLYVVAVAAACWVAGRAEEYFEEHDSHKIVIDEIVGYVAATMFLQPSWGSVIAAFVIFRVLDVLKPFPAGYVDQRLTGGAGVVLDDVVSGIYTNLALQALVLAGILK